jgi:hypothetical protein
VIGVDVASLHLFKSVLVSHVTAKENDEDFVAQ